MVAAIRACGLSAPPPIPASELSPRGRRHSRERDARAVRHHYDVSNDFFALLLDESMTYSCALFSRGARTLERAGTEPVHGEGLRRDYAETLSHWIERLDANRARAGEQLGPRAVGVE